MAAHTFVTGRTKPFINVTPLIDVLLVLPDHLHGCSAAEADSFRSKAPGSSDDRPMAPNDSTLVVTIGTDHSLKLNSLDDMGTVEDTAKLSTKLAAVFSERKQNHAYSWEMMSRTDLADDLRLEKTVFIKAPRDLNYGAVVKVIDGIKVAGATPIGLQLDGLN